jgi:uncharacterized protein YceK
MTRLLVSIVLVAMLAGCAGCHSRDRSDVLLTREQYLACENDGWHEETGIVQLDGVDLPWTFSITNKGNGGYKIAGVLLRLYDGHDDGRAFEPELLQSRWIERNGRRVGFSLFGVQEIMIDEDGSPMESRFRDIAVDCIYDAKGKTLSVTGDRTEVVIAD